MINIEDYFEKGYVVTHVPDELLSKFWREIYTTEWVEDETKVYKSHPSWYTVNIDKQYDNREIQNRSERKYGDEFFSHAPESVRAIARELLDNKYFDPLKYYKPSATLKYLHVWNGAEEIPWHMDAVDGSDILIFVYLTEETEWDDDWGGCLGLRKELSTDNLYETKVQPLNGTMVVINNANPLIKHKVWPLINQNVNRYIFSMCFTWD